MLRCGSATSGWCREAPGQEWDSEARTVEEPTVLELILSKFPVHWGIVTPLADTRWQCCSCLSASTGVSRTGAFILTLSPFLSCGPWGINLQVHLLPRSGFHENIQAESPKLMQHETRGMLTEVGAKGLAKCHQWYYEAFVF